MDDRESIYLDTISLASEYPNRKSMSLSRQTIYHSAEDMNGGSGGGGGGSIGNNSSTFSPNHLEYGAPTTLLATSPKNNGTKLSHRLEMEMLTAADGVGRFVNDDDTLNGTDRLNGSGGGGATNIVGGPNGKNDEVSARLLFNNDKTVTYAQWKSRVTPSYYYLSHMDLKKKLTMHFGTFFLFCTH